MDIHVDSWKRSFSATTIYSDGNIVVSLGASTDLKPENMGIVEIKNMGVRVIGGEKFANQLNEVAKTSTGLSPFDYKYKKIAINALFTEFLTNPDWGADIIADIVKKAFKDGRDSGKYELRTQLKDLLGLGGSC